ncbi:hypothetical protein ACIBVL_43015 [Streptomyces sp. NPDC049687]|uniref:hypothetical protein n=1 Tax=Streptomyces sp. NPDC049687 TaxID=3365596 RepID=UPI0037B745A4
MSCGPFFHTNDSGDLAAQDTWARFTAEHGDSAYGLFWFGALHTANYSLLSPYPMGFFGVRTIAGASGPAADWLAAVLFARSGVRRPLAPALMAAFGLWVDVAWSGRRARPLSPRDRGAVRRRPLVIERTLSA